MIFDLLPMVVGAALAPVWMIIVLLILRSPNGLVRAISFVAGVTIVRLLQGFLFGYVLKSSAAEGSNGESPIVSVLLMVLGILLLISAVKKLMNEDDSDAPPPKWMSMLDQAKAPTLFGLGVLFTLIAPKLWVFTLSAIGIIWGADLSPLDRGMTFLAYVLGAQALMILPLVLCAIAPRQSASLLQSISNWLMRYKSQITLVVSLVFGSFFLWKGLSGLSPVERWYRNWVF
ncbi:GAP family protein [Kovacikia minuta CCNUW1]|uniref:GAP family protein n=1 Tax=Kovacikia minuta TaxID=2931930 RepID=UPI001CCAD288|nr:GAP family protein [Kovacikia minuta]UBF24754.1 GAP family protein [Kovacikia minuta CCNUW1]